MATRLSERRKGTEIAELSVVTLVRDVTVDGKVLPGGAQGTVVGSYGDGLGYEVEFEKPFHAVVTLHVDALTA